MDTYETHIDRGGNRPGRVRLCKV